jgi:ankyrin repeat protein
MEAAQFGRTAIAKFLISIGADVNARTKGGLTAIILAASRCRPAIVAVLLKNGAMVESGADETQSILRVAAVAGDWTSMRLFLRTRGSRPARRQAKGTTIKSTVFSIPPE